jgi:hypothetical protein
MQAEGIFRITPENSQEEHVREQLNRGVVPDDIDVHCLASLIKVTNAWANLFIEFSYEMVVHIKSEANYRLGSDQRLQRTLISHYYANIICPMNEFLSVSF